MQPAETDSIYPLVSSGFEELGASDPNSITHGILLRDQFFVGHRFQCEGYEAICRMEEGLVEFYGQDSELLKTVPWGREALRKAA